MACAQESRTLQLDLKSAGVKNSVKSFFCSKKHMKILCRIGLFNIIYHRLNISKKSIVSKSFEKVPYFMYKSKCKDPIVDIYHSWVHGILEAIDKNYLKEVYLYLKNKENNDILEAYSFRVFYNKDNDASKPLRSDGEQMTATVDFLKILLELENHPKIDAEPSVEITYNDGTPNEYEPPCFAGTDDRNFSLLKSIDEPFPLTNINTGFHKLKSFAHGDIAKYLNRLHNKNVIQTIEMEDNGSEILEADDDNMDASVHMNITITTDDMEEALLSDDEQLDEGEFSCVCGLEENSELMSFTCASCNKKQHAECSGKFTNSAEEVRNMNCLTCSPNSQIFDCKSDPKAAAISRIALVFIKKTMEFPGKLTSLLSKDQFEKVRSHLKSTGVIEKCGKGLQVNTNTLNYRFSCRFPDYVDSQFL